MERNISWFQILLGVALGLLGFLSSVPLLRLLGGIALLASLYLGWSEWRRRRQSGSDRMQYGIPEVSAFERWLPWIFITLAVATVLFMTWFTFRQIDLF